MSAFEEMKQSLEETIAKRSPEEEAQLLAEWNTKQSAAERRDLYQRLRTSAVPDRVLDMLIDGTFEESHATRAVRTFLAGEDDRNFLLLAGRPGVGKTFAGYLGLALWGRGQWGRNPGHVYKASEIARVSLYDGKGLTLDTVKRTPGVLLIDDLGTEFATERGAWLTIFEELIDHRYEHGTGTIVTSNLNTRDLLARYGERIMSRIQHTGTVVEIAKAKNYRREP